MKNKFVNLFVFISMLFVQDCFAIIIKRDIKTVNSYNPENEKFLIQTKNGDKQLNQIDISYNCLSSGKMPYKVVIYDDNIFYYNFSNRNASYLAVFDVKYREEKKVTDKYGNTKIEYIDRVKTYKIRREGVCNFDKVKNVFIFKLVQDAPLSSSIVVDGVSYGEGKINVRDYAMEPTYKEEELYNIPDDASYTFIGYEDTDCSIMGKAHLSKAPTAYFPGNGNFIELNRNNIIGSNNPVKIECNQKECFAKGVYIESYSDKDHCYVLEYKRIFDIMEFLENVPEVGLKAINFGLVEPIN